MAGTIAHGSRKARVLEEGVVFISLSDPLKDQQFHGILALLDVEC
jgi:hypothetical protein